jgi:hypothetical protein
MKKRRKAHRRGHAAKKKTAKKKSVKAWPIKKVVANIETRLAHVESHLAQAGHARGRSRRRKRR